MPGICQKEVEGRSVLASFLHNGTLALFERSEFQRTGQPGKNHWVVTKIIDSQTQGEVGNLLIFLT
jgi:hypothetical protein